MRPQFGTSRIQCRLAARLPHPFRDVINGVQDVHGPLLDLPSLLRGIVSGVGDRRCLETELEARRGRGRRTCASWPASTAATSRSTTSASGLINSNSRGPAMDESRAAAPYRVQHASRARAVWLVCKSPLGHKIKFGPGTSFFCLSVLTLNLLVTAVNVHLSRRLCRCPSGSAAAAPRL